MQVLVDTNIIVDALRGVMAARDFFLKFSSGRACCSVITSAEIWAGTLPADSEPVENLLNRLHQIPVDIEVARQAGEYVRRFSKAHGVQLADALIASTAQKLRIPLATRNIKHFPMDDIQIVSPY